MGCIREVTGRGIRPVARDCHLRLLPLLITSGPAVLSLWIEVVCARMSPPDGPRCAPTAWSNTQGFAPATKFGSLELAMPRAQTELVSSELCQVTRDMPFLAGFGLRIA